MLAVEADPTTCDRLRRNVAANPELAPAVEVVGSRVAMKTKPDEGTVSLDDLAYGADGFVPDLVKLDVEGMEVRAIRGGQRLLSERRPHVIVETHSQDLDAACRELLEDHGYAVEAVEARRWAPEVRTAELNRWLVARGHTRPR
ncbi:MAG TPA: FkbM family methyltransferase [Gaiellaceae bacterium]|nr:FkbM family methyltransferase [Gaiellaceae bacterium]